MVVKKYFKKLIKIFFKYLFSGVKKKSIEQLRC